MNITVDGYAVSTIQGGVQGKESWQTGQPTLVLVHGAGMDNTVWVMLARYFADHGYNIVAMDLPQHGASKGVALDSIDEMANWLWRLIEVLQNENGLPDEPIILAGHSMGSLVCLAAALQRPDSASRTVLLGTGYPMRVGQPLLDAAQANEQAAVDMIVQFGHAGSLQPDSTQPGHKPVADINVTNRAAALLERAEPGVLYKDLQACNQFVLPENGNLLLSAERQSPTFIIAGSEDRMTPMKTTRQLAALLEATVDCLPACGHMIMNEQPELTLQAMLRALQTHSARA
ncbi:MAG: alpha/beta hydrolase [Granulosicoccus sp.]